MQKLSIQIFVWFLLFSWGVPAATVTLGSGFFLHKNTKKTTAVTNRNDRIELEDESQFYPGFTTSLDISLQPHSFGLVGTLGFALASHEIALNQYNIENYEYFFQTKEGNNRNVIYTDGSLQDFNLQEEIGRYIRENEGDYKVRVNDFIIHSSFLFKYNTPAYFGISNNTFDMITKVLRILNLYTAVGFSNIIINRSLAVNETILSSIKNSHGASLTAGNRSEPGKTPITVNDEIKGRDPAPDPDFYFSFGGGMNLKFPDLKLFGTQIIYTVEFIYHISLSPDDQQKPFDDQYIISQDGYTIRLGSGLAF